MALPYATQMSKDERQHMVMAARHLTTHGDKPFTDCVECDSFFSWVEPLEYHENTHKACIVCGENLYDLRKTTTFEKHLMDHVLQKDGVVFLKEIEGKSTTNKRKHSEAAGTKPTPGQPPSDNSKQAKKSPYLCIKCGYLTDKRIEFSIHMRQHAEAKCDICDAKFPGKRLLEEHLKRHKVCDFPCTECNKSFVTYEKLRIHMLNHTFLYECPICKKRFMVPGSYHKHVKSHSIKDKEADGANDSEKKADKHTLETKMLYKDYVCEHCGHMSESRYDHRIHLLIHEEDKKFVCDKCQKRFKTRSELKQHSISHDETPSHICKHCGRGFKRLPGLKSHILCLHTKELKYECDECDGKFKTPKHLRVHKNKHHRNRTQVECHVCGKRFYAHSLRSHLKTHISTTAFECECGKIYRTEKSMRRHKPNCSKTNPAK